MANYLSIHSPDVPVTWPGGAPSIIARRRRQERLKWRMLWVSGVLQVCTAGTLLTGRYFLASLCVYSIIVLAIYAGVLRRNIMAATGLLVSSYGLSIVLRDFQLIGFSTYYYAYIVIAGAWVMRRPSSMRPLQGLYLAFLVYLCSILWGTFSYGLVVRIIGALAAALVWYEAVRQERDLEYLVSAAFSGALFWVPVLFYLQAPGERFGIVELLGREYGNPISYASSIAIWVAVGVWLRMTGYRPRWPKLLGLGTVLAFGVLAYSSSRTMLLMTLVILFPVIIVAAGRRPLRLALVIVLMLGSGYLALRMDRAAYRHVIENTFRQSSLDRASAGRTVLLREGWDTFAQNPAFGSGLAESDVTTDNFDSMVIHSFWVKLLAEAGLLGGGAFLFLLVAQTRLFLRKRSMSRALSVGLILGMLIYGMLAHGLDLVMWPSYALALAIARFGPTQGTPRQEPSVREPIMHEYAV